MCNEEKNVIWCVSQSCKKFEGEYLSWLIPKKINNNLIIYSDAGADEKDNLEAEAVQKRIKNHILIHLSDESCAAPNELYLKASKVLRPYFFPGLKNVYTIPLGFQSGYAVQNCEIYDKEFSWAFVGQIKNHRKKMLDVFAEIPKHYIYKTDKWKDPKALSSYDVKTVYSKTWFVPCPFGNINPDSFRVMEALEAGSVPVVVKFLGVDYFKFIYGDHPFIVGRNWEECASKIRLLMDDPIKLNIKNDEVRSWYMKFKKDLKYDVFCIINEDKPNLVSMQFEYQKKAGLLTKFFFNLYFKTRIRKVLDRLFHS